MALILRLSALTEPRPGEAFFAERVGPRSCAMPAF
jgi:hypothetical protein